MMLDKLTHSPTQKFFEATRREGKEPEAVPANVDAAAEAPTPPEPEVPTKLYHAPPPPASRMLPTLQQQSKNARAAVAKQFTNLAADPDRFHELMRNVFGEDYDRKKAQLYRTQALAGDLGWMPPIRFVSSDELGGAKGAYDKTGGVVYLNKNLLAEQQAAAQVYLEEFGHFLDATLNRTDSKGDEGELFRRLVNGEQLSTAQVATIRAENDQGTITVQGRTIQVEFWKPFRAIGKALSKAGRTIKKVGEKVVAAAKKAVNVVAKTATKVGQGIGRAVGGFFSNAVKGDFKEAFKAVADGARMVFVEAPMVFAHTLVDFAGAVLDIGSPVFGSTWRTGVKRVTDAARSAADVVVTYWQMFAGGMIDISHGFADGLRLMVSGKIGAGFKRMGKGYVDAVGGAVGFVILAGGKIASIAQVLTGKEPVGRELTAQEIATLRSIYGDSIDYELVRIKEGDAGILMGKGGNVHRPFVLGNTIYMKNKELHTGTLVHEMMHIWQFQNEGANYLPKALNGQDAGYDWKAKVPQVAWQDLHPEAQGSFLAAAFRDGAIGPGGHGRFGDNGEYSEYLAEALRYMRRGQIVRSGGDAMAAEQSRVSAQHFAEQRRPGSKKREEK